MLTPEDETALDRAMSHITDSDIQNSMHWLNEIANDRPTPSTKAMQQKKETTSNGRQPQ